MQDTFAQRLAFVGLDNDVEARLAPIADLVERHVEIALERFSAQVATSSSAARFLYGRERLESNGEGLAEHWRALAAGRFDAGFAEAARRMGLRHARIGLETRWHVGSYASLVDSLVKGVIQDGMAAALQSGRGALGLFGRPDEAGVLRVAEAMAEGLSTLLSGVLLDIDLSLSGYIAKLREDGLNGVEAQRQRLRQAVEQAGQTLELAADGQRHEVAAAPTDPDLAPLYAGAERLADKVIALIAELEGSHAALREVAGDVAAHAAALTDTREEQEQSGAALADTLAKQVPLANELCAALDDAMRRDKAVQRKGAGLRKSAMTVEAAHAAQQAALDGFAEQLDALHLSAQLLAAQGEDAAVRALSAGLGRLSGQFRAHRVQSAGRQEELTRSVAALCTALERLNGIAADNLPNIAPAARTAREQLACLSDMAAQAHELGVALSADREKSQTAMEGVRDALLTSDAFADLVAAFASEETAAEETVTFPDHDQTALAAHWHAG
ncbi:methyl-accepting chemotaxis protein [Devosia subaequoris]|uniref:Methyl-accepting chemotaxis protein n=1 Tax=Devosia subaequoris TaxID=395930 RepID=A0A7W6NCS8_9HYPH|nr:protoglobin domain-containing protein [Devosia subaequoris]MBB4053427.1 methyl-accepting chemotaxis protein [Devosia subaequoris]MCP1210804.1 protoglobin domain-containing protein [Devosia subaequoris]